jgi:hypothetical protein
MQTQFFSRFLPRACPSLCAIARGRGRGGGGGFGLGLSFCSVPLPGGGEDVNIVNQRDTKQREQKHQPHDAMTLPKKAIEENLFHKSVSVGMSSFVLMSTLTAVHMHMDIFEIDNTMLLGSFGASCFLLCYSPEAPIAQPRNVIGGHLLGASCGVLSHSAVAFLQTACDFGGITMLPEVNDILTTYAPVLCGGPLAVSSACMLMMLTRTVHFPAGGTALGVALSPTSSSSCAPADSSFIHHVVSAEVITLMGNILFSSSTLVVLACLLHKGAYPYRVKSKVIL